jgi:hypothetical protein
MGEKRNACRVLLVEPEGKIPLGRPRHRSEDDIKMDRVVWTGASDSIKCWEILEYVSDWWHR